MEKIEVKDLKNGTEVATHLMGRYLNQFGCQADLFINYMRQQPQNIRDNFTYLVFAWLHALSEVTCYDERNEASVNLAQKIFQHIGDFPQIHILTYKDETKCWIDLMDSEQVVKMMASYLVADSKNFYHTFLDCALRQHRTLQQSMTRLFRDWLQKGAADMPLVKESSIYFYGHALPMI